MGPGISNIFRILTVAGLLLFGGLYTPITLAPNARASAVWLSTTDSDFNGTGRVFKDCTVNGTGDKAQVELARIGDWVQKTNSGPSAREMCPMAAIGVDDNLLLFGGYDNNGLVDDTWVYDLGDNKWTMKSPADHPVARYGFTMSSILGDDKVVLFGGYEWDYIGNYVYYNDTWVYDLSDDQWYLKSPAISPPYRVECAMASIVNDDKVVLFGGYDETDNLDDTWVYDLSDDQWTQKSPTNHPMALASHEMATVPGDDKVLLFGGYNRNTGYMDDTWMYDLSDNQWYDKNLPMSPSGRESCGMATLFNADKVLLFGGYRSGIMGDTWVYDIGTNQWSPLSPYHKPQARYDLAMAAPYKTDKAVLFGGWGSGGELSDTWMYYLSGFSMTGEYTSPSYDTGGNSSWVSLNWTASVPPGTELRFKLRTGYSLMDLESRKFFGPTGSDADYYTEDTAIWYGHYGDRYVQYKAFLNTSNIDITPAIKQVSVFYNRFPRAPDLAAPANDSWTNSSRPTFRWAFNDSDSENQGGYEWQMGRFPENGSMNHTTGDQSSNLTFYVPDSALDEGYWFWRVRTQDAEGDWGPFSEFRRLGVDLTPPRPFAPWAVPSGWTSDRCSVWFTTADDLSGMDGYQLWIDGKPFGAQESPFPIPATIPDGVHTVIVRASDKAGNYADAKVKILIDKTPPKPFVPKAVPASWSRTDPQIEFMAEDNGSGVNHYDLKVDDGPFARQKSPLVLEGLKDGTHDVYVRAVDVAGNYRDANLTVYVDRSSPEDLFVTVSPAVWTNTPPEIAFSAVDATSDIDHYEMKLDNGNFTVRESPYSPANLTDGIHKVTVRAYDLAGNYAEEERQLLSDRTPPNTFTPTAEPSNWTGIDPVVSFSATDDTSGIRNYEVRVDSGRFSKAKSPLALPDLPDGEHNVTVRAYDDAGNFIDGTVKVYVDRSPPAEVSLSINEGKASTGKLAVTLSISARDAYSGPDQMCFSNDGTVYTGWETFATSKSWTLASGTGERAVYVKVRDRAGNEARAASATITYKPPEAGFTIPVGVYIAAGLAIAAVIGFAAWRVARRRRAPPASPPQVPGTAGNKGPEVSKPS